MQITALYSEKLITREEINQAVKEFLERGGHIHIFPPQVAEINNVIPVPFSAYEELGVELF